MYHVFLRFLGVFTLSMMGTLSWAQTQEVSGAAPAASVVNAPVTPQTPESEATSTSVVPAEVAPAPVATTAQVAAPAEKKPVAGYDGGFFIQSDDGKNKMKIGGTLLPQYQYLSLQRDIDTSTFQIALAQIRFSGHYFDPRFTYSIGIRLLGGDGTTVEELDGGKPRAFAGVGVGNAWVNYKFVDEFNIRFGQMSTGTLGVRREDAIGSIFIDGSQIQNVFTQGGDLGLMVHGALANKKLDYKAFVTNEGGNAGKTNPDRDFFFGTRWGLNVLGDGGGGDANDYGYSEKPQLYVAASGTVGQPYTIKSRATMYNTGADAMFRYRGLTVASEVAYAWTNEANQAVLGFMTEVGYFVIPKKLELGLMYSRIMTPQLAGDVDGQEMGGQVSYYFAPTFKIAADYTYLVNSPLQKAGTSQLGQNDEDLKKTLDNCKGSATCIASAQAALETDPDDVKIETRDGPAAFIQSGDARSLGFSPGQNDHRVRVQATFEF